jgi:hypothetical protein
VLIEHSFVTTLPPEQAMGMASEFLARGGFVAEADQAFDLASGGQWTTLQVRRGRTSSYRAKDPTEAPQRVRLEWDRGRIAVAASIDATSTRGRSFSLGPTIGTSELKGKRARPYADLMVAISQDVDDLLVGRVAAGAAGGRWFPLERQLRDTARKARRRSWIILGVFLVLVIVLVAIIAIAGSRH